MNITAGKYKGQKIIAPDEKITRPTLSKTREAIFSVLFSLIDFEGRNFLDLFAGSGIMGLEALSRGFENVFAIEKNHKAARIINENYKKLGENPNLVIKDSLKAIPELNIKFDVIYIDPPYLSGIYEKALETIKLNKILGSNGVIILEHTETINFEQIGFIEIKQKNYSGKMVTFIELA